MKSRRLGSLAYPVIAFFVLWTIGLFVKDGLGLPSLLTPIDHLTDGLNVSDPLTFATAAKDVAEHGWISPQNEWIFHLWPPGFVILEAVILKVIGNEIFLIPALQIISCALLAGVLSLQRTFLKEFVSEPVASVAPFLLFVFPVARIFLIEPLGIIFGETFSVSFYLGASFLILRSIKSGRGIWACGAGLSFAAAAYFRSQYESLLIALTAAAIPLLIWQVIEYFRNQKVGDKRRISTIRAVVICLAAAHMAMLPWRLHNLPRLDWVQTMDLVVRNSLASEQRLLSYGGGFVIRGGGDLACRLEPSYCDKEERALFWKAFIKNLPEWYRIKISLLPEYWNASVKDASSPKYAPDGVDRVANFVLLMLLLLNVPLLVAIRRHPYFPVLLWFFVSTTGGLFLIYSLVQFEIRYFYLLKLYGVVSFGTLCAVAVGAKGLRKNGR